VTADYDGGSLRLKKAPLELRSFVYLKHDVVEMLPWESWLRQEAPVNMSGEERISVSFNYEWG
jgi:uncharacterized protein (TIGR02466 family)